MKEILGFTLAISAVIVPLCISEAFAEVSEGTLKELYAYLEKVQREVYNVQTIGPADPRSKLAEELVKRETLGDSCKGGVDEACPQREALEKLQKKQGQNLPTEYEDERYNLVKELARQISDAAKGTIDFPPIVGTLPTVSVNACTLYISDRALARKYPKARIVVFNRELFNFALLFGKAVVATSRIEADSSRKTLFQVRWPEPFTSEIEKSEETFQGVYRFYEVMHAALFEGRPGDASHYTQDPLTRIAAQLLIDAMELFIMGHEFAHVVLDHKPQGHTRLALVQQGELSNALRNSCAIDAEELGASSLTGTPTINGPLIEAEILSYTQEYEADIMGLILMLKALRSSARLNPLTVAAPLVFCDLLDVLDKGNELISGKPIPPSKTHPLGAERYKMLLMALHDERVVGVLDLRLVDHLHARIQRSWELASRLLKKQLQKAKETP